MVDSAEEVQPAWLGGVQRVGVTAGASAPDVLVQAVIARIKSLGALSVTKVRKMDGIIETVKFPLPKGLKSEPAV
jgi:4-hydroxy-3-methylbut-2-enyl diphosphate reductase